MPGTRRGFGLLVVALCVLLAALVAIPALADEGAAGVPLPPPPPPGSGQDTSDGGSTAGYPNASEGQAETLFTNNFSDAVHSLSSDPPDLSGEHPDFLDNHAAVVSPNGGGTATPAEIESILSKDRYDLSAARSDLNELLSSQSDQGVHSPQLISSVLPLRVGDANGQAPVDLSLDQQGADYTPDNPLVDLKLPDRLDNNVALGDNGIKVDLGATDSATADPINGGDNLFYADAAPATDVVLAPISSGLESFYQLRAPESPEHFQVDFTLPAGAQLTDTGDGGAAIIQDGDTLGSVYAPSATDAAGNPINVSMSVNGDSLELDVPHSDPGIHYPISVDPVMDLYTWSSNGAGRFADWVANKTTGSPYQLSTSCTQGVNCQGGLAPTGLYVEAPVNQSVAANSTGAWQYSVPHYPWTTTYISLLNIGPLNFTPRTDTNANPFMFAGIYADNSSSYLADQSQSTAASNLYWGLDPGAATTGKKAVFSLWSWVTRNVTAWRDAYLGGAAIWLGDGESPDLTSVSHSGISVGQADWSYSNWVDNATPSVSVTAQDSGIGVKSMMVPSADGSLRTVSENCDGSSASPCPQHPDTVTANYDTSQMDDGANITGVVATDALDKSAARTFVVRVDHTAPILDITGGLSQTGEDGDPNTLHVDATDGDAEDASSPWGSGVRSVAVYLNGQQVATTGNHDCPAVEGSCPLSLDYSIDPTTVPGNSLHFEVRATDELGHVQSEQWDLNKAVIATGTLTDALGNPTSGTVYVYPLDTAVPAEDSTETDVAALGTAEAGADGHYQVTVPSLQPLQAMAADNGGWLNVVIESDTGNAMGEDTTSINVGSSMYDDDGALKAGATQTAVPLTAVDLSADTSNSDLDYDSPAGDPSVASDEKAHWHCPAAGHLAAKNVNAWDKSAHVGQLNNAYGNDGTKSAFRYGQRADSGFETDVSASGQGKWMRTGGTLGSHISNRASGVVGEGPVQGRLQHQEQTDFRMVETRQRSCGPANEHHQRFIVHPKKWLGGESHPDSNGDGLDQCPTRAAYHSNTHFHTKHENSQVWDSGVSLTIAGVGIDLASRSGFSHWVSITYDFGSTDHHYICGPPSERNPLVAKRILSGPRN